MEDSIKTSLNVKSFGKTVFLTKAEAEQKAKEIEHELHEKICKATVTENRQKELSELKFRRFETDLWKEQEELLRKAGYFVYDLRNWDEGDGYNIEIHVSVNHIGNWITDIDLTPYMNQNSWIGIDELESAQIQDIPYNEISDLLLKGDELHKAGK